MKIMRNRKNKLIALIVLTSFLFCCFGVLSTPEVLANFQSGQDIYYINGVLGKFLYRGEIRAEHKKPDVKTSEVDGVERFDRVSIFEQSKYGEREVDHDYYRTVAYAMMLVEEDQNGNLIPLTSGNLNDYTTWWQYDNWTISVNESEIMRNAIESTPGWSLNDRYVIEQVFDRNFFKSRPMIDDEILDRADYLLKVGIIELYNSGADGKQYIIKGGVSFRNIDWKPEVPQCQNVVIDLASFRSLQSDFLTRIQKIPLTYKKDKLKPPTQEEESPQIQLPAQGSGNALLSEKRISRIFDLGTLGAKKDITFSYSSYGSCCHTYCDDEGCWTVCYDRSIPKDDQYQYVVKHTGIANTLAVLMNQTFTPRYKGMNIKTPPPYPGFSTYTTNISFGPNMWLDFYRGKDKPTLASYKEPENHELVTKAGFKRGKTPQESRNTSGGYTDTIGFRMDKSAEGDYSTTYAAPCCGSTATRIHQTAGLVFNLGLTVQTYLGGGANVGAPSLQGQPGQELKIGGITFNNTNQIVAQQTIKFYPYIQMAYDKFISEADDAGQETLGVNVLAQHESTIKPYNMLELGWANSKPNESLNITSNQWSTHARAVNKYGKNNVLPGGAVYTLDTKNNQTRVGMRTWEIYLPNSLLGAVTSGGDLNRDRTGKFYEQAQRSLDTTDVVQYIYNNPNAGNAFSGVELKHQPGQKVYGNTTSNYDKYWLKRQQSIDVTGNNRANLDILENRKVADVDYKIRSDINGDVYVEKSTNGGSSWSLLQKISKTQGVDAFNNTEIKTLDEKTKLVTAYLNGIDRNKGNDPSVGNGPAWYNEAWDGICVHMSEWIITIGFKNPGIRSVALDPKLTPMSNSLEDMFKVFYLSQFRTDVRSYYQQGKPNGYLGDFHGQPGILPNYQNLYMSRKFWIPNATVMDLD